MLHLPILEHQVAHTQKIGHTHHRLGDKAELVMMELWTHQTQAMYTQMGIPMLLELVWITLTYPQQLVNFMRQCFTMTVAEMYGIYIEDIVTGNSITIDSLEENQIVTVNHGILDNDSGKNNLFID